MSSAILYLAIVVIWAFLLVPRWVRRSHASSFAGASTASELPGAEPGRAAPDHRAAGAEPADDDADTAPLPVITAPPLPAVAAAPPPASSGPGGAQPVPAPRTRPAGPPGPPRPAITRSKVLQARRRLLTILILLALAAGSCTALHLTSPWVCVPPAVMLGMYVLLLRETALADAERVVRAAEQQAAAARQQALARSRADWAARTQPSAQIIDISGRLKDQLYDQYQDATDRAVGD